MIEPTDTYFGVETTRAGDPFVLGFDVSMKFQRSCWHSQKRTVGFFGGRRVV